MIRYIAPLVCLVSGMTLEMSRETIAAVNVKSSLSEKEKLNIAKHALLKYWEEELTSSEVWKKNFADQPWKNVEDRVHREITSFEKLPNYAKDTTPNNSTTFVSQVFGLKSEITVSHSGKVNRIYVEMN